VTSLLGRQTALFDQSITVPAGGPVQVIGVDTHAAHLDRFGPPARLAAAELVQRVLDSGLTGRGGGHFPVAAKWRGVSSQPGRPVLVVNGAESEPLSAKDAVLLQLRPHLVLDGIEATASALGATEVVLWLHSDAHFSQHIVRAALADRRWDGPPVRIVATGQGYLSGESSAAVRALSGGPTLPSYRAERGRLSLADGRPALVHNVESLARIGLLTRGIDAGSVLVSVSRGAARVVLEAWPDWALVEVLRAAGVSVPVQATLVGGYGGRWLAGPDAGSSLRLADLPSLGAGVLLPLPHDECGLACSAAIVDYLAEASARQCGPCRLGLPMIAEAMAELADFRRRRTDAGQLRQLLQLVAGRGACSHPDGVAGMVASALDVFGSDVDSHLHEDRCRHAG